MLSVTALTQNFLLDFFFLLISRVFKTVTYLLLNVKYAFPEASKNYLSSMQNSLQGLAFVIVFTLAAKNAFLYISIESKSYKLANTQQPIHRNSLMTHLDFNKL
jgi:hypothetical protein